MSDRLTGDVYATVACGLEGVNLGARPGRPRRRPWPDLIAAAAFAMIVVPGRFAAEAMMGELLAENALFRLAPPRACSGWPTNMTSPGSKRPARRPPQPETGPTAPPKESSPQAPKRQQPRAQSGTLPPRPTCTTRTSSSPTPHRLGPGRRRPAQHQRADAVAPRARCTGLDWAVVTALRHGQADRYGHA